MEKTPFVINDVLLLEEFCNLQCSYCEGFSPTEYRFKPVKGRLTMPSSWRARFADRPTLVDKLGQSPTVDKFFDVGLEVLAQTDKRITYPVLKLSGGEIFLYKGLVNFVRKIHKNYGGIQLLTNGTLFSNREIELLRDLSNVYFQISLDGITVQGNYARSHSEGVLKIILQNISKVVASGMGLEINCVLSNRNTQLFEEFVKYMSDVGGMMLLPRPVRGEPRYVVGASETQIRTVERLAENYERYSNVLPPKAYFERVLSVLQEKKRTWRCYVPFFVFGMNNYGTVSTCTCSGELPVLGEVFDTDSKPFEIVRNMRQYDSKSTPNACSDCVTQYELFNLYVESKISEEELSRIPTFSVPGVLQATREIKRRIVK